MAADDYSLFSTGHSVLAGLDSLIDEIVKAGLVSLISVSAGLDSLIHSLAHTFELHLALIFCSLPHMFSSLHL